ncbi:tyrosine-type recombinase/integrase [Lachnospiraceae bacterium OttesenSCG-928-D06]|nr:tyrosine-type recombinase/integrase [Lachnospiraceae bacterium OttesenSCG-928-D06]
MRKHDKEIKEVEKTTDKKQEKTGKQQETGIKKSILKAKISAYEQHMKEQELSDNTIKKYLRDLNKMFLFEGKRISKETMVAYKRHLVKTYEISSVNSYLVSANRFLKWADCGEYVVKINRLQKRNSLDNVLTKEEYNKMLQCAKEMKKYKSYFIMRTLTFTGIRIGELQYVTLEAVKKGTVIVFNKGKYRQIYFPQTLCDELIAYAERMEISKGIIFRGRNNEKAISSSGVWRNLKYIAGKADVDSDKVYPHSFRHLFAKMYMRNIGDITELANLLGHSRLESTWVYTQTTTQEKRERLDTMIW